MNQKQWGQIVDYFGKQSCKHCGESLAEEGIAVEREVTGAVVVKVNCVHCKCLTDHAFVGFTKKKRAT